MDICGFCYWFEKVGAKKIFYYKNIFLSELANLPSELGVTKTPKLKIFVLLLIFPPLSPKPKNPKTQNLFSLLQEKNPSSLIFLIDNNVDV